MRESQLEAYFRRRVVEAGGVCVKVPPASSGVPDRLVILPGGKVRLVEMKAPGGRIRPIQEVFHERAAHRGVHVAVLTSKEEVDQWLKRNT